MKCKLHNTCELHRNWCCNFCTLKCDVRCKDRHEDCRWFDDSPMEEVDDMGNLRMFTYKKNDKGDYVRHYLSLNEIRAHLTDKGKKSIGHGKK